MNFDLRDEIKNLDKFHQNSIVIFSSTTLITTHVNSRNSKNAFCKTHSTHQFKFLIFQFDAENFSYFNFFRFHT